MKETEQPATGSTAYKRLAEGLSPEQQHHLGDLGPLVARLAAYAAPEPTDADRARLLAMLNLQHVETARPRVARRAALAWAVRWFQLSWAQTAIIEPPFWWACGLAFLLGLLVTALHPGSVPPALLAFLAPAIAAAGVAYAFRPATETLGELEKAAPTPLVALFYARFSLVLAVNLLFSLALITLFIFAGPPLILWRFLLVWVGPMFALSGLAMWVTIRWGALAGLAAPLAAWAAYVAASITWALEAAPDPASLGGFLTQQMNVSNPLLFGSLAALAGGLLLAWQAGQQAEVRR